MEKKDYEVLLIQYGNIYRQLAPYLTPSNARKIEKQLKNIESYANGKIPPIPRKPIARGAIIAASTLDEIFQKYEKRSTAAINWGQHIETVRMVVGPWPRKPPRK